MPIIIPRDLPAYNALIAENIFAQSKEKSLKQDIRPLKVAIVNLMPTKIETETQLLRLLSNTPIQVDITLIRTETYISKHASAEHMANFYKTFSEIKAERFDALFITGAPVELHPFEEVGYWKELCEIMEWSKTNAFSTIHICWGAFAGLYYHYNIDKRELPKKLSGIYKQEAYDINHPLLKGFDDIFYVPQSRHTEMDSKEIEANPKLKILAGEAKDAKNSEKSGAYIIADKSDRQFFITGHAEYDRDTLKLEYLRDKEKGLNPEKPVNYFPDDDVNKEPNFTWRGHGSLMYSNLLNFCVYHGTPYNLDELVPLED